MNCISLSFKNAGVKLRKRLAFPNEVCCKIASELLYENQVRECVILCTCNRTEAYFCGNEESEIAVVSAFSESAGISESHLLKNMLFFREDNAINHLFKVACGIDSMVIGEDEILGQTKSAYINAAENHTTGYELNMIFQAAFACAKRIKTDTPLSRSSVSIATLAANEAAKFASKVNVLIIGAGGKIGSTVLKNLFSHKNVSVTAALRRSIPNIDSVQTVDYKSRYDCIKNSDCIISATSSPHYTITLCDLKEYISDGKPRLFIDLAVPPDIDSSITEISGVKLINIDHFEKIAKKNNSRKIVGVDMAKEMIRDEIDTLKKDLLFHDFLPNLPKVRDKSIEDLIYKMKSGVPANEFSAFLKILEGL